MPLVNLSYNSETVTLDDVLAIRDMLPRFVSYDLSGEELESALCEDDIEVCVREFGSFDRHSHEVEIIIDANEYPSRLANLEERNNSIKARLVGLFEILKNKNIKLFVWTRLMPAAFAES